MVEYAWAGLAEYGCREYLEIEIETKVETSWCLGSRNSKEEGSRSEEMHICFVLRLSIPSY